MSTREPTGDVRLDRIEQRLDEIGREVYSVHLDEMDGIPARLDALETRVGMHYGHFSGRADAAGDAIAAFALRLERLESARIAAPVAPESAATASGVPVEPGNATEAPSHRVPPCSFAGWLTMTDPLNRARIGADFIGKRWTDVWAWINAEESEVAAALRMYRKVQGCRVVPNCGYGEPGKHVAQADGGCVANAAVLLAWLKEGEA